MKIYISGDITGVPDYKKHFNRIEQSLRAAGHEIINPAIVNNPLPKSTTQFGEEKVDVYLIETHSA